MKTQRGFRLFILLLVAIIVITMPPFFVPGLAVGGSILIIIGIRYAGQRHGWPRWSQVVATATGLALLAIWAVAPCFVAPPRHTFPSEQAQLAVMAEQEVHGQLDSWNALALHVVTQRVVEVPDGYRTCTTGFSYFYAPLFRYDIHWDHQRRPRGGSLQPWPLPCPKLY